MIDSKKTLSKLWGISERLANILAKHDITRIEDIRRMDTEYVAELANRPIGELKISREIAKKSKPKLVEGATERTFPIAWLTWGVGLDLGLYLYTQGFRSMIDITEETKLVTPDQPPRMVQQLSPVKSQVLLMLIKTLPSKIARILVEECNISTLEELSRADETTLSECVKGDQDFDRRRIGTWPDLASKLVQEGITDYRKAAELPLAKEYGFSDLSLVATLYVLDIRTPEELVEQLGNVYHAYLFFADEKERRQWAGQSFIALSSPVQVQTQTKPSVTPRVDDRIEIFGRKFTRAELELCFIRFWQLGIVNWCQDTAWAASGNYESVNKDSYWEPDAFRHAFWSCILAKSIPPEDAWLWTWAHEQYSTNNLGESRMDLHNNKVGILLTTDPALILDSVPSTSHLPAGDVLSPCELLAKEAVIQNKLILDPEILPPKLPQKGNLLFVKPRL